MKKRNRNRNQTIPRRSLDRESLRAATGGSKEAYFVRCDRSTTTDYASGDDSTESR